VLSVSGDGSAVLQRAMQAGVPAAVVGVAQGDRLRAANAFDVPLADADRAWRDAIPNLMAAVPTA
jgi:hypothetical protein